MGWHRKISMFINLGEDYMSSDYGLCWGSEGRTEDVTVEFQVAG